MGAGSAWVVGDHSLPAVPEGKNGEGKEGRERERRGDRGRGRGRGGNLPATAWRCGEGRDDWLN